MSQTPLTQNERKEELQDLDNEIDIAKATIELGKKLKKLTDSDEFKAIFEEAYYKAEVDRVTSILTEPSFLKRDQIKNVEDVFTSIRGCKQFLQTLETNALTSEANLEDMEQYRKTLLAKEGV